MDNNNENVKVLIGKQHYQIRIGQKFYRNNYGVSKGHIIPDYLIIQKISPYEQNGYSNCFIEAKYENHGTYTKERKLSGDILTNSNLNPECKEPDWIFT